MLSLNNKEKNEQMQDRERFTSSFSISTPLKQRQIKQSIIFTDHRGAQLAHCHCKTRAVVKSSGPVGAPKSNYTQSSNLINQTPLIKQRWPSSRPKLSGKHPGPGREAPKFAQSKFSGRTFCRSPLLRSAAAAGKLQQLGLVTARGRAKMVREHSVDFFLETMRARGPRVRKRKAPPRVDVQGAARGWGAERARRLVRRGHATRQLSSNFIIGFCEQIHFRELGPPIPFYFWCRERGAFTFRMALPPLMRRRFARFASLGGFVSSPLARGACRAILQSTTVIILKDHFCL